jgi:hypothetical protein
MRAAVARNVWRRALGDGIIIINLDHVAIFIIVSIRINFNADVNWSPSNASVAKIDTFHTSLNSGLRPLREDRTPERFVHSHRFLLQPQSIDWSVCLGRFMRTLPLRREYCLVFPFLTLIGCQGNVVCIVNESLSWFQYFQSIVKWRGYSLLDLRDGFLALGSHLFNLIQFSRSLGARGWADGADGPIGRPAWRIS